MGWKDWSYWLKGGVIGLVIYLLIATVSSIAWSDKLIIPFVSFSGLIFNNFLAPLLGNGFLTESISIIILSLIFYFISGSIIGWLYGKIKNRGKENE